MIVVLRRPPVAPASLDPFCGGAPRVLLYGKQCCVDNAELSGDRARQSRKRTPKLSGRRYFRVWTAQFDRAVFCRGLYVCVKISFSPQNFSMSGSACASNPVDRNIRLPVCELSYSGCLLDMPSMNERWRLVGGSSVHQPAGRRRRDRQLAGSGYSRVLHNRAAFRVLPQFVYRIYRPVPLNSGEAVRVRLSQQDRDRLAVLLLHQVDVPYGIRWGSSQSRPCGG